MEHLEQVPHTVIGEVVEGKDILEALNGLYCDEEFRPYQDVRITHTYILDDPFPDPDGFETLSNKRLGKEGNSPERTFPPEETIKRRIPYEEFLKGNGEVLGNLLLMLRYYSNCYHYDINTITKR